MPKFYFYSCGYYPIREKALLYNAGKFRSIKEKEPALLPARMLLAAKGVA